MPGFHLDFSSATGITLGAMFLFLFLIGYKVKIQTSNISLGFTAENATHAQGIFIAVVVLHHISQRLTGSTLYGFKEYGYIAVGVFFLLSGYGLAKSFIKKERDYLSGFIEKKTRLVVIPFIFINIITSLVLFLWTDMAWGEFVQYILSIRMIDSTSWFIVVICMYYVAFYCLFKLLDKNSAIILITVFMFLYVLICKALGFGAWVYKSSFCFSIGLIIGMYELNFNRFLQQHRVMWVVTTLSMASISIILLNPDSLKQFPSVIMCIVFAVSVYVCLSFVYFRSPLARFMGNFSLEIYLIHMKLMLLLSFFIELHPLLWLLFYFVLLFICSYLFSIAHTTLTSFACKRE